MANNTQRYRYKGLIVEVSRISDLPGGFGVYHCLVRGFGHNNPLPRKAYNIHASTNAQASRKALIKYEEDGKEN